MKGSNTKSMAMLALAALVSMPNAYAHPDDPFWYIGGNLGQSSAKIDRQEISDQLASSGSTMTSYSEDDREFGYKLFGGYQFNRYVALESGYFDLGEFGFTAETSPPGSLSGDLKVRGIFIDPVGILPITEKFSAFGRVGLTAIDARSSFTATGAATAPPDREQRSTNYKLGLGLQYDLTERFGLRAEVERYRVDDGVGTDNEGDLDLVSLGLVYRFISTKSAPAQAAASPAPAQAVASSEQTSAPAPAPVNTENYCSSLNIAFEINKGVIQREEKERLAVLGTFMTKYPSTTALIEGHSDSVGSEADNQRLSEKRAESVVRYLVDEIKIAPSRLKAVGFGEGLPIADNNTSEGKKANRRIVAVIHCVNDIAGLDVVPARLTLALELEFDEKSAQIDPRYYGRLAGVAKFMKAHPGVTATVEGHAEMSAGLGKREVDVSPKAAMDVSKRRAQNVVNRLVEQYGIERSRLVAEGFGQTRRATYGATLAEQQENRRVHIIFNYPTT